VMDNAAFVFEVEATYHGMDSMHHQKVVSLTSPLQRQWISRQRYVGSEKGPLTYRSKTLIVYVPFAPGTFPAHRRRLESNPRTGPPHRKVG